MFIYVNYYCTKNTVPKGTVQWGGGWAMVGAKATTNVKPNEI